MSLQLSVAVRNTRLDGIETAAGAAPKVYLRTGSAPATCATADSGALLATMTLPSDWLQAAASGQKQLNGTWTCAAAVTGTAGHFRIKDSTGTTCHFQGTVGLGTGDLQLDSVAVAAGQNINITVWVFTDGNA